MKNLIAVLLFILCSFSAYGQFVSVCYRTPQVRTAIMKKIAFIDSEIECQDDDLLRVIISEFETLDLRRENIISLKQGDFSGLSSLQTLYLGYNSLGSLPPDIFSGLSALQALYINDNNLTSLPPDIFSRLFNLERLDLRDNELASLPPGIFTGLFDLKRLFLNDNNLTSLPPGVLAGLSAFVFISRNPLSEQAFQYLSSYDLECSIYPCVMF